MAPPSEDDVPPALLPLTHAAPQWPRRSSYVIWSVWIQPELGIHRLVLGSAPGFNVSPKEASERQPLGSGLRTATFRTGRSLADKSYQTRFDSSSGNTIQQKVQTN